MMVPLPLLKVVGFSVLLMFEHTYCRQAARGQGLEQGWMNGGRACNGVVVQANCVVVCRLICGATSMIIPVY